MEAGSQYWTSSHTTEKMAKVLNTRTSSTDKAKIVCCASEIITLKFHDLAFYEHKETMQSKLWNISISTLPKLACVNN